MRKNKIYIVIIVLLLVGIIHPAKLLFAAYYDSTKVEKLNQEVKNLNQDIANKKSRIEQERNKQNKYAEQLQAQQIQSATLANQIAILDNRIKKIELDIEDLTIDINISQLEINKTATEIKATEGDIKNKESNLSAALKSLYRKNENNLLEILILNDNLSDFLNQVKYLEDINASVKKSLSELGEEKNSLEAKKQSLLSKNEKLDGFKADLNEKMAMLDIEKESKAIVLEQSKSSEKEYAKLLEQAKSEQLRAQSDIASIEKEVRSKLSEIEKNKIQFNDKGFVWPVPPNTITAYFHDKDYPYRYIFEHPAVDIRAEQGTVLRAAASGYVARAKYAGTGYSYIMLIHGNGLSTVYGHVSKIMVKEDQYITQGQQIGLTGGKPGTTGAGPFTTGPHLHFEIRLNGIPVNPLKYLP